MKSNTTRAIIEYAPHDPPPNRHAAEARAAMLAYGAELAQHLAGRRASFDLFDRIAALQRIAAPIETLPDCVDGDGWPVWFGAAHDSAPSMVLA